MLNVTDRVRLHSARLLGVSPNASPADVRAALAQHVGEDNVDRLLMPTNREVALLPDTDRLVAGARFLALVGKEQKDARQAFLVADSKLPATQQVFPLVPDHQVHGIQDALIA